MGEKRRLQAEIDRCLKKVQEGVEIFEEIWQKVHNATNTNQKEKYETDLKKEIKKLQRLRDQIKTWAASNDIKDKSQLLDARRTIETQMERFKIVERETKTKAYSKEGLGAAQKLDPAQKEKDDISAWLTNTIDSLNMQNEQIESEIEQLIAGNKKKKIDKDRQDKLDAFRTRIEKHMYHVNQLETILRLCDNDVIDIEQIKDIKEDVDYYVDFNQEPDFEANEEIYSDLNLEDIGAQAGLVATSPKDDDSSITTSDGPPESPCGSMSPSPSPSGHSKSVERDVDKPARAPSEEKRPPSITAITPVKTLFSVVTSVSQTSTDYMHMPSMPIIQPINDRSSETNVQISISEIVPSIESSDENKMSIFEPSGSLSPNNPSLSSLYSSSIPLVPDDLPLPPLINNSVSLSASNLLSANASLQVLPNYQNLSSVSQDNFSQPTSSSIFETVQQTQPVFEHLTPDDTDENATSIASSLKSMTENILAKTTSNANDLSGDVNSFQNVAPTRPGPTDLKDSFKFNAASFIGTGDFNMGQPRNLMNEQNFSDFSIQASNNFNSHDLVQALQQQQQQQQHALSFSNTNGPNSTSDSAYPIQETATMILSSPVRGAAPLGPVNMDQEQRYRQLMHEAASSNIPHPSDSERIKNFMFRVPYTTPSYYPQVCPPQTDSFDFFQRLTPETLFFIFYYEEGTKAQYLAAKALKKQSWRFHTKYMMWFQRHEEPKTITDDYEMGTYIYWDYERWSQRRKEQFTFEYRFLEDRELP